MSGIIPSRPPSTPLTSLVAPTSDAINARVYDLPLLVAQGLLEKKSWVAKSGKDSDIDTADVPVDLWGSSSVYTGFPTGAAEVVTAVSDSASDTGTLTISYLASATSTAYQTATITLNGLTPVDFAVSAIRVHTAFYNPGTATGFNVGSITIRHKVTTTNVFQIIVPNTNQSYSTGYTVPYNSNAYLYEVFAGIQDGALGTIEAALWVRLNGVSPRLRRSFVASQGSVFSTNLNGSFSLPALTDLIIRITSCSANNTIVVGGYNILIVQN